MIQFDVAVQELYFFNSMALSIYTDLGMTEERVDNSDVKSWLRVPWNYIQSWFWENDAGELLPDSMHVLVMKNSNRFLQAAKEYCLCKFISMALQDDCGYPSGTSLPAGQCSNELSNQQKEIEQPQSLNPKPG